MFYAGIDWADQKHDALVLDAADRKLGSIRVAHSPEGLAKLDEWLGQMLGQQSKDQMACIIETTHGLPIAFLLEHGWPVYPVNPRTVDRKRAASGAKTDTIDAYLLAKTGRADFADLHRLVPDSEKVAELKTLTRDQDSFLRFRHLFSSDSALVSPPRPLLRSSAREQEKHMAYVREKEVDFS